MQADLVRISKFLSLVLRHKPAAIGLQLDENGWADIAQLIQLANANGNKLTRALLEEVVQNNDKKRFAISDDGQRIRASQGHSIDIDLALAPSKPPTLLYHGTATRFVDSIRAQGLLAGKRQHVHLSLDLAAATKVGERHGKPAILQVRALEMHAAGHDFYLSANHVWLTAHVPVAFIDFPA